MKVERSNFILVPNSALTTNVFLQTKCNMHSRYDHASWSWSRCMALFGNPDSSLIMPDFDLSGELSLKIELHMLRPITEKVHSGNGPVSLVLRRGKYHDYHFLKGKSKITISLSLSLSQ